MASGTRRISPILVRAVLLCAFGVTTTHNAAADANHVTDERSTRANVTHVTQLTSDNASGSVTWSRTQADILTGESVIVDLTENTCFLAPVEPHFYEWVGDAVQWNTKLIEYTFDLPGYEYNPLATNNTHSYKTHQWSRVVTGHGQTILNLAFNYGILSLMTLTFGVERVEMSLSEQPVGCLMGLSEEQKVNAVLDLVLRDMAPNGTDMVTEGQGNVCHRVIIRDGDVATFTQRCCCRSLDNQGVKCIIAHPNKWLKTLDILLACLMCAVFIFGAMFVPDWIYSDSMRNMEYSVILKEGLYKKVVVCRRDITEVVPADIEGVEATHTLDLRNKKDFVRCRRLLTELPENKVIPIKVERYDITVNYRRLLQECKVPVGMTQSIFRSIFLCKLRNLEPFRDCCYANMLGDCTESCTDRKHTWLSCCKLLGRILLVVLAPVLFYLRLVLYYVFEHPEIMDRKQAAEKLELPVHYNYRLMQYLTPTHPVFVAAYIIYMAVGMVSAVFGGPKKDTRFHKAIMEAFGDLKDMTWLSSFSMMVKNLLWPFKEYGLFIGCIFGVVIWPIFLPISSVVCFIYCLPIVFLTCRIVYHLFTGSDEPVKNMAFESSVRKFEAERMLRKLKDHKELRRSTRESLYCTADVKHSIVNVAMSCVILATMYSSMLMVAEAASYLAEIICFSMMGLIVNASKVLRYGTLLFLVMIYSYDTYNNVNKKYLKLNKALFSEIQRRIKDLEQYTSLPSNLQENRGFKSCENSEQDDYEAEDDINLAKLISWDINDLILFVDQDDQPRIPKKLFEEVCAVRVAGSPGPVYRSLLEATGKFFIIILFLVFVFIVVMSFGDTYKISATNQTLATLAGGFMPFIFTSLLKPTVPQVETGLVSFKSKLEEIIKNFHQVWPMYDFVFDVGVKPEDSDSESGGSDSGAETPSDPLADSGGAHSIYNMIDDMPIKTSKSTSGRPGGKIFVNNNGYSDKKEKAGKEKKKEKDKKKNKEKEKKSSIIKPHPDTKELMMDIKAKIEDMDLEDVEPGTKVDIKILVSDRDHEWLMSSSLDSLPSYAQDYIIHMQQQGTANSIYYDKDTGV